MRKTLLLTASLMLVFTATHCLAGGFQLYSEGSADILGLAGAGVARATNSSAWYNPATTVDIDRITLTAGGSALFLGSEYKTSARTDKMDDQPRFMGYFYGVMPLGDDYRLNLSVNAPYGMITQWKNTSQLNSLATFTSLRVCYITPSLTWKVNDNLSVAAGPNVAIGVARLATYINLPYGLKSNKNYMSADAVALGGFLSLYYKFNDEWAVGAKYQSRIHMRFEGENEFRYKSYMGGLLNFQGADAHASIDMPAYLALGLRNNSIDRWTFLFDATWTQWSSYKALDLCFDKYPGTDRPGVAKNPRKWHDVWTYHLGAEYQLTDQWVLRAGLDYDNSPANRRAISPEMPDSDKWLMTVGAGYQGEHWGFDVAYGYSRFAKSKLGTQVAASHNIAERGTFKTDCHIVSTSVTYKF
ncbi:MAG: OmpP1/FadL family transporter [Oligosphaeraceae bacterium]